MKSKGLPARVSMLAASLPLAADDWAQHPAPLGNEMSPEHGLVDLVLPLLSRGRLFVRVPDELVCTEVKKP